MDFHTDFDYVHVCVCIEYMCIYVIYMYYYMDTILHGREGEHTCFISGTLFIVKATKKNT